MALSPNELKRLQQKSWGNDPEEPKSKDPAFTQAKKPNKYLNIIRKDMNYLISVLSGGWTPIGWFKKWSRMKSEHQDFMETHFGRKPE